MAFLALCRCFRVVDASGVCGCSEISLSANDCASGDGGGGWWVIVEGRFLLCACVHVRLHVCARACVCPPRCKPHFPPGPPQCTPNTHSGRVCMYVVHGCLCVCICVFMCVSVCGTCVCVFSSSCPTSLPLIIYRICICMHFTNVFMCGVSTASVRRSWYVPGGFSGTIGGISWSS